MSQKKIYLIHSDMLDFYKIGVSKNPSKRVKQLQTGCPYTISLHSVYESEFSHKIEKALHRRMNSRKADINDDGLYGEWFDLTPDDVIKFKSMCKEVEKTFIELKESGNPFI